MHTGKVRGVNSGRQLNLFSEFDYEKLSRMDGTVDGIRRRFGGDAVMRASFLGQPIDHMSGGISRNDPVEAAKASDVAISFTAGLESPCLINAKTTGLFVNTFARLHSFWSRPVIFLCSI